MAKRRLKFTGKKRSRAGAVAAVLGVCGIAGVVAAVLLAVRSAGSLGVYVAPAGMALLILSVVGFLLGFRGSREEDVYPVLPRVGMVLSGIAAAAWGCIYYIGF